MPLHPQDLAGKIPINLKHGVFETTGRKGTSVEHVAFNANTPIKLFNIAPKEFLRPYFPPLQHAETPHLEAHLVKDGLAPGKESTARSAGTAITFDHKSESIMLARQVMQGGKNTTVTDHFGGAAATSWPAIRGTDRARSTTGRQTQEAEEAPVEVQEAVVAPMEDRAAVVVVALTAEAVVAVVAAEEEAPTSSSSFRIVECVAGSHLDLGQEDS